MLSIQALQAAHALATKLDDRSMAVVPVEGSILDTLVKDCGDVEGQTYKSDGAVEYNLNNIADFINRGDGIGANNHDLDMDEVVGVVATAVTGHINVARTVVAPAVDDMVSKILPQLEQASRSTMSDLEVVTICVPAPLLEPSLISAVEKFKDVPTEDFVSGAGLPSLSETEIVEIMKSGATSLDGAIETFLSTLQPGFLSKIWKELFTPYSEGRNFYLLADDSPNGLAFAMVGFLVARKIWNKPMEGVNMSASSYEKSMLLIREQSALRLVRELNILDRQEKNEILVRAYTRNSISVNERVYNKFLKEGGSNEILLGNLLSNDLKVNSTPILENKERYLDYWKSFLIANRTTEANLRFAACKSIARLEFGAMISNLSHDELPVQDRQQVVKLFEEELKKTTETEIADPYRWVMRLVCKSRFYKTDSYRILSDIALIRDQNQGVETREAASIATMNYIGWWIGQQFRLTGCVK